MQAPLVLLFLSVLSPLFHCCTIWGTDMGECVEDPLYDHLWREAKMPFCSKVVKYPVCVPKFELLPSLREFPEGRWSNNSIKAKDAWIAKNFEEFTFYRIGLEKNKTLRRTGKDETGLAGSVRRRFWKRPDCQNAYKNLFCWMNFPRCDMATQLSMPVCKSSCENFFNACGYQKDLWRCGRSAFFNGYAPEAPTYDDNGDPVYLRDFFPGQPFRKNKYTTGNSEMAVCTPALTGAASLPSYSTVTTISLIAVVIGMLNVIF